MTHEIQGMRERTHGKSAISIWAWAVCAALALASVAAFFWGLEALPPSTRAAITDYAVEIGIPEVAPSR